MLQIDWSGWKWLAVGWLVLITVLFILPGSALPKENWLNAIHFDKWVHFGLFAILLFLFRFYYSPSSKFPNYLLIVFALVYGLGIEWIQGEWVENRSSDLWDVVADMAGAVAGLIFWLNRYKKNKPL